MRGALCTGAAIALFIGACGCAYDSPQTRRQNYQARQAERLRAAKLPEADQSDWHALRVMRARVYVGPSYRSSPHDWRERIEEQFRRANAVLRDSLELRIDIEGMVPWDPEASFENVDASLAELARHDAGDDVDWVVGFVGSLPRAEVQFRQLGAATLLGKHMVLRDMDNPDEQKALSEGLDTLDAEERRRLYRDRREHKETVVLLHELGHTLGALHVDHPATVMHPSYDNRAQTFSEPNATIMKRVLAYRAEPEERRDDEALIDWLASYLENTQWPYWVPEERAEMASRLREALNARGTQPGGDGAPIADANAGPTPPELDVSKLPEADRERFAKACGDREAKRYREAWTEAAALADAHPQSYAVQHLACSLAMETGRALKTVRGYCERMQKLAGGL